MGELAQSPLTRQETEKTTTVVCLGMMGDQLSTSLNLLGHHGHGDMVPRGSLKPLEYQGTVVPWGSRRGALERLMKIFPAWAQSGESFPFRAAKNIHAYL